VATVAGRVRSVLSRGAALAAGGRRVTRPAARLVAGKRGRGVAAGVSVLAVGVGLVLVAATGPPGHGGGGTAGRDRRPARLASRKAAPPLRVLSVSPAKGATGVDGASPVSVRFSAPLAAHSPMPALSPAVPGQWSENGPVAEFTPAVPFRPSSAVRLRVPAGQSGVRSAAGGVLASPARATFHTQGWSTLRLEQLLAQLGYLPLSWSQQGGQGGSTQVALANGAGSTGGGFMASQLAAVYSPPAGRFTWRDQGYPASLVNLWQPGQPSEILTGAVMAFEAEQGIKIDGVAGPQVWNALLRAVARNRHNPNGYTYAVASKGSPETLTIWHNGRVVERTPANTGIPGRPTVDGTFPVYSKFVVTIMQGTNPDGSHYHDIVHWVSYFNGGDAVHYFPRASYGFPQSLGCVEIQYQPAVRAYRYLTYGSLVSVQG